MNFNNSKKGNVSRSSNGKNQSKKGKLSFHKLEDLIKKTPEEILCILRSAHSGFDSALNEHKISKDRMALILIALGKASRCDERHIVQTILKRFNMSSNFIYGNIQKYLCSLQNDGYDDQHLNSLSFLIIILEELHRTLRASSSETLSILLPLFKSTVQKLYKQNNGQILKEILHKIEELEKENDNFIECQFSQGDSISEKASNQQLEKPPDDFRELAILPHNRDDCLNYPSFLRPIIRDGRYEDVEHYLDVHFRLLHEDILRPLREGIQEYITSQKRNTKICLKDVRLYRGVCIQKPVICASGLAHLISFESKPFKNIVWENSKRLLYGSLLCLSHDNFQTMLFATVAARDTDKLKNGLLVIQFEHLEEIFELNMSTNFVMMETNAYFEAYRHVLSALQEIKEDTFPLKDYIVHIRQDIEPPQYLTLESKYNFQSIPSAEDSQLDETDVTSGFNRLKEVTVLDTKTWPSELLGLDKYQLAALKTALSKKLAIIQGPPGTGKTYIGLKIVHVLLNNCTIWNPLDNLSPILVVCYTNHALDQFLEGILPLTTSIVRVGGRSSNPVMHEYQLNTLRTQLRSQRKVPEHIFHNITELRHQLMNIQQEISMTDKLIEAASNSILTTEALKNYIKPIHYQSFVSESETNFPHILDKSSIIVQWLGLLTQKSFIIQERVYNENYDIVTEIENRQQIFKMQETAADFDSEEYADVEYITNQRIIDTDEPDLNNQDVIDDETIGIDLQRIRLCESDIENNWQVQNGHKQRKQFIKAHLQSKDMMTVEEAEAVVTIWNLSSTDRWRLYRMWIDQYIKDNVNKILENQKVYKQLSMEYEDIRVQEDINLMLRAKIVGMTTSGAAKYRSIVQKLKSQIVIVEEAAEVLEAHIITSLTPNTQHLILIGDHQQLRPSPTVYELARRYNLDLSFFERMIKNGMGCSKLFVQHRMRPCISELLIPHIYKELYDHPSVKIYEDIKGMEKNMFFISHDYEESCVADSKSKRNVHEADFLIALCRYLLLQGYKASQITVLTMYTGQMFLIKKRMIDKIFHGVRVTVVDNFQGEENDIILISFVRSNDEGSIGFLGTSNRICVALSRAKKGLYCIGNFSLFAEKNEMWRNIMTILTSKAMVGTALKLKCQIHQEKNMKVVKGEDFNLKAPEGGCDSLCDVRLECGHVCTLSCHPYDKEHKNFKCNKQCQNKCTRGHQCPKKCHEECGPCLKVIFKQIPSCKHYVQMLCSQNPAEVSCNKRCSLRLPCGHQCLAMCGKPCLSCSVEVKCLALCGHEVSIVCSKSDDEWEKLGRCKKVCTKELKCGHLCKGSCKLCVQFRFHVPCSESCNRILICGHECKFPCAKSCPPCERKCENRCIHSRCPAKCGEKCTKCNEKCKWRCGHLQCTEICGNKCNRPPCNEPCNKQLNCGHQCIGLCGERCPTLCRICDEEVVTEIFFGTEDEPDAQFIRLDDCGHTFEVTGLTQYMEIKDETRTEIQMKACPKCKIVIRRSHRFSNIIKTSLQQIEMVKEKVSGQASDNKKKQENLLDKVNLLQDDVTTIKSTFCELKKLTRCKIDVSIVNNVVSKMLYTLSDAQNHHAQSLICMDNYIIFLGDLIKLCKNFLEWHNIIQNYNISVETIIWDFFSLTIQTVLQIMDKSETPTEQMLSDINQEMHRLEMFAALFQLIAKTHNISNKSEVFLSYYYKAVHKLLTFGPLENDDIEEIKATITQASRQIGGIILGISDKDRKDIVKAIGLSQGHWFACPNGHVYCIGECGGAMEEGKCIECQARIGGQSHRLRNDNQLARAMDNAEHAAWSDAANILNYDLNINFEFE